MRTIQACRDISLQPQSPSSEELQHDEAATSSPPVIVPLPLRVHEMLDTGGVTACCNESAGHGGGEGHSCSSSERGSRKASGRTKLHCARIEVIYVRIKAASGANGHRVMMRHKWEYTCDP